MVDQVPALALLAAVAHLLTLATHDQTTWRCCTAGETDVLRDTGQERGELLFDPRNPADLVDDNIEPEIDLCCKLIGHGNNLTELIILFNKDQIKLNSH